MANTGLLSETTIRGGMTGVPDFEAGCDGGLSSGSTVGVEGT